jgi:signal transduction histidine kinase
MFPVEIDAAGLIPALRELASTTESVHRVPVEVEGDAAFTVEDARVATQLYRIAQEAVTNAVKHAQPHTIRIELRREPGLMKLRIVDDGSGMKEGGPTDQGLGLRIMRYRATSIGALLAITPGTDRGTIVTCTLRETPRDAAGNAAAGVPDQTSA